MTTFKLVMPKMGESVLEATITKWHKKVGEFIQEDDALADIATDKVDSEIPSPVDGILKEVLFKEGDVVLAGTVIAIIETEIESEFSKNESEVLKNKTIQAKTETKQKSESEATPEIDDNTETQFMFKSVKFFSPLVKTIASAENISLSELDSLQGSGKDGRITKDDVFQYLNIRQNVRKNFSESIEAAENPVLDKSGVNETIEEMGRMRRLIADHMVNSVKISAHVTSFKEVKMGKVVQWREGIKKQFESQYGEKLSYTHIILEAATIALQEFPRVNASVDKYNIILKKNINIGFATALTDGNLIVPVIKHANHRNLLGLVKETNRLANLARTNKLQADDITEGTFTFTNLGSFGTLTGTPIINQPQVAILGAGVITKKPIVIETSSRDTIGIEPMMILSLSYDHRIVDGAMGGLFLNRVAEVLENFDIKRTI